MTRLKVLKPFVCGLGYVKVNDIVEVEDSYALSLINASLAEKVETTTKKAVKKNESKRADK